MPDTAPPGRPLYLPWNQAGRYWLCVVPKELPTPALGNALSAVNMDRHEDGYFTLPTEEPWAASWKLLHAALRAAAAENAVEVAVVGGESLPDSAHITAKALPPSRMAAIAESLWLGEALLSGNVVCYLQPVVSQPGRVFGYEAFARARRTSGEIAAGFAIVNAGRALGIEYALDRHLQVEAIRTFAASGCGGFLFVNFLPGFIQRPEVYLDGLSQTARSHGIVPKHLVLDFTRSGDGHDANHLKRVCDYCRSKGYAIALDDVESLTASQQMITDIRPDYVKLDIKLVLRAAECLKVAGQGQECDMIRSIVRHCHANGVVVLAEGVETEESYDFLKAAEVDLFQGYLFSPPVPAEKLQKGMAG